MDNSIYIKKAMRIALSGEQLLAALHHNSYILPYNELKTINNIITLLTKYGSVILLYETSPRVGHWICLILHSSTRTIEFFDSYGFKPDDESKFIPEEMWKMNYLSILLKRASDQGYNIEYNEVPLQNINDKTIATCGRWVVFRLLNKNIPLDLFQQRFKYYRDRDYIVTQLTYNIL